MRGYPSGPGTDHIQITSSKQFIRRKPELSLAEICRVGSEQLNIYASEDLRLSCRQKKNRSAVR